MRSIVLLFISQLAFGHARLVTPAPRDQNPGIKIGQCGGLPRRPSGTTYQVGQTYTVRVQETIQHSGHFIINLLNGNLQQIAQLANVVDAVAVGTQDIQITLNPALGVGACTDCVVQLIQSMEETGTPSFYYSCSDIVITDPMAVATPIPPAPTPTPGASPVPGATPGPMPSSSGGGDPLPQSGGNASDEHCGVH